jgi:hypothetical protein
MTKKPRTKKHQPAEQTRQQKVEERMRENNEQLRTDPYSHSRWKVGHLLGLANYLRKQGYTVISPPGPVGGK